MPGEIAEIAAPDPSTHRRPVLVAIDFSSSSASAVLFAAHFAACVNAPLMVLHVVHEPSSEPGFYRRRGQSLGPSAKPLEDVARDMLTEFLNDLSCYDSVRRTLADARTRLVKGLPAHRIQEVALQEDAALIVLGSRGRSRWWQLAASSVAAQVTRHSPVPVTVVKASVAARSAAAATEVIGSQGWWRRRIPLRAVETASAKTPGV
jgi:nucleotide-binding universal stress UspA family protein